MNLKNLATLSFLAPPKPEVKDKTILNTFTHVALRLMALQFNLRPALKNKLKHTAMIDLSPNGKENTTGKGRFERLNFTVGIKTQTNSVRQYIRFQEGKVTVLGKAPEQVNVTLTASDDKALKQLALTPPSDMLNLILKNRITLEGNLAYLQLFNYCISLVMGRFHEKMARRTLRAEKKVRQKNAPPSNPEFAKELALRKNYRIQGTKGLDSGVKYLDDPFLPELSLDDFPRLSTFFKTHLDTVPEVDPERISLLTQWYRANGWEKDAQGNPWFPEYRNALAFKHLMTCKQPIIRENDLIAGTTGSKEISTHVFGDGQGTLFWGELDSVNKRTLSPYTCTRKTADILHREIFPFWADKTFREHVRLTKDTPLCQKIDERWVAYYVWKSTGISHTIPNFERLLTRGCAGIKEDIRKRSQDEFLSKEETDTLKSMTLVLEGVEIYADHLAREAAKRASAQQDAQRKKELEALVRICSRVPREPATSLAEAFNAINIIWTALHNENSDTGLSLGRLDQLLQLYFERDIEKCSSDEERQAYIKSAVELAGCFVMRLTDHVPMLPDIANYLFGGATSTQAITLGGVTKEGEDGVNDMTYVFLKTAEMLVVRDANFNCRYNSDKNSDNYLKRLCEVNIIAQATPIMHSDQAMFKALGQHGYPLEDIRDWAATGCVEPTIQGKHNSHTASILLNMVASMEMALNNGFHPLMGFSAGPETGQIEKGDFKRFQDFFDAWEIQQKFIIDQACTLNNYLGEAHGKIRPTPLLSVLQDGTIESAKDVLKGGAIYNSSGTSNIGLADVIDSLLVIKQLVFDEKKISFQKLKQAIDADFEGFDWIHAMVSNKVPQFRGRSKFCVS
ncbi:MAG: SCP2 sterol-binding domain-containing protein [Desulfobacter sp.]|nr:MAG: SCP2 sterol-binding domain-containing protein [Desulfobacter sp.]